MGNGAFNTKIEADFYGYCGSRVQPQPPAPAPRLWRIRGWLIGQTWSTFMDLTTCLRRWTSMAPGATSRRPPRCATPQQPQPGQFQFALEEPSDGAHSPNLIARMDKGFDWGSLSAACCRTNSASAA